MGIAAGILGSVAGGFAQAKAGHNDFQAQAAPIEQTAAANDAVAAQNGLIASLQAQNGLGNQSQVYNQAQGLAGQLQNMANGQGPNPAQAQLNQNTAANTANQAALMAGQRGASANPALIARMAAQQGAANQQNAIGQGATLQAQQQLSAIGALQNQQGLLNNIAGTQASNLINTQSNQQNAMLNQSNFENQLRSNNQNSMNAINSGVEQNNANNAKDATKQAIGSIGSVLGSGGQTAPGGGGGGGAAGLLSFLAEGGEVQQGQSAILKENYSGPRSKVAKHLFAKGGEVQALVSPGEIYLPPEKAEAVKQGKASPLSGEKIQGQAPVGGAVNSYDNDIIPKTLEAGGIVLPRSVTQSKDPSEKAKKFVEAIKKKQGK